MDTLNNLLRALAEALVPFIRDALVTGEGPGVGVLTEDNFDPSDHDLMTNSDFEPSDWNLLRSDEFDYSEWDLVTTDSLTEAVEEAVDEALSNLSITRD
ncbi:MAG: hypothetical protein ABGY29_05615 [bacterium]|jgi:hypothetical protein